jgi:hypothetical protein
MMIRVLRLSFLSAALLAALLPLGCGTNSNSKVALFGDDEQYSSVKEYDVDIEQTAHPMIMRDSGGNTTVPFAVTITNRLQEPLTVERISMQTLAKSVYEIVSSTHKYKETIPAGGRRWSIGPWRTRTTRCWERTPR